MTKGRHLDKDGMREILSLGYTMNLWVVRYSPGHPCYKKCRHFAESCVHILAKRCQIKPDASYMQCCIYLSLHKACYMLICVLLSDVPQPLQSSKLAHLRPKAARILHLIRILF